MKTFNIAYATDAHVYSLVETLSTYGTVLYRLENIRVIGLEVADDVSAATIEGISGVVLVELDAETLVTPQAYWHQIRLVTNALPLGTTYNPISYGDGVVVYLMDSGINAHHEEFTGSTIENLYTHDGFYTDALSHGTSMASLINGQTRGVSKNAIVKNVKIPFGFATIGQLLTAFDAILTDHLLTSEFVKVVNCSWTVPKSQLLDNKVMELQNAGLVVVAAAGNTGVAADTLSPVGLNTVLGVAASDLYDRVISWAAGASSNWGPEVDITAPGIQVSVANIDGYGEISGTSVSAAIVSGVVAQYIKEASSFSAQQIQTLVLDSAFEDMLFRNESVYGTTPNRLIKAPFIAAPKIWDKPFASMFPVQRGVTTQVTFTTTLPISAAAHEDHTFKTTDGGSKLFKAFSWITSSYVGNTLTLSITPPSDFEVGKYTIQVISTDAEGSQYNTRYSIGVYNTEPSELDAVEIEKYLTEIDGVDTLTVVTAACTYNLDCGKFGTCRYGNCS